MEILDNLNGGPSYSKEFSPYPQTNLSSLVSIWWTKPWSYFVTPAGDERRMMMPLKLQGYRLPDPIRIFRFRCRRYRLNRTDPKDKSEKSISDCSQSIGPGSDFWKCSLSFRWIQLSLPWSWALLIGDYSRTIQLIFPFFYLKSEFPGPLGTG